MLRQSGLLAVSWCRSAIIARGAKKTIVIEDPEHGTIHLSEDDDVKTEETYVEENLTPNTTDLPDRGPRERCINSVTLLGRVGRDPQQRGSENTPVTVFSMATTSMWKNPNPGPSDPPWTTRTDWHNIAVFKPGLRDQAYNYIVKGSRIHVTGKIVYGEVVDKMGIRRHTTTIAADDIIYLVRPKDA